MIHLHVLSGEHTLQVGLGTPAPPEVCCGVKASVTPAGSQRWPLLHLGMPSLT